MIDNLLDALRNLVFLATLLVALRWAVQGFPQRKPWPGNRVATVTFALGLVVTSLLATSVIRDRELFMAMVQGLALLVEGFVVWGLLGYWRGSKTLDDQAWVPRYRFTLLLVLVGLQRIPGFLLAGSRALGTSQMSLSTDTLVATFSLLGELALVLVAVVAAFKVSAGSRQRLLWGLGSALVLLTMADQLVSLLQILGARGAFSRIPWMMKGVIAVLNFRDVILLGSLGILLMIPLKHLIRPRLNTGLETTAPQRRRALALKRREFRWATVAVATVVSGGLFLTFGQSLAETPVVISQAEPVTASAGWVGLELSRVDDGLLHRYSFATSGGTEVRFIVVKKGGATFGVGLDACEVCGPTGYFQRQGQVICRLCDVQMNKATIGFPGGCNPVPLRYSIDAGQLRVQESALEAAAKKFR